MYVHIHVHINICTLDTGTTYTYYVQVVHEYVHVEYGVPECTGTVHCTDELCVVKRVVFCCTRCGTCMHGLHVYMNVCSF